MSRTISPSPRPGALLAALALTAASSALAAPKNSPWGERYFPNVELTTHDGRTVKFYDDLIRDKHVVVSFVYTRCSRVCGLMTAKLAHTQRLLGERVGRDIHFYTLTMDPEHDTPEKLASYLEAFKIKQGWTFLTGKKEDIQLLRKKFGDVSDITDHKASVNIGYDPAGQWWTTSSLDNPRYLAAVIGDWMTPGGHGGVTARRDYAREARELTIRSPGHKLFRERCVSCHLAGGQSVGPDLAGVVQKRGHVWVSRWLKAPDQLIAEKDPTALALLEQAGGIPMPNLNLTDAEVAALVRYLEAGDIGAPAVQQVEAPSPAPTTATN